MPIHVRYASKSDQIDASQLSRCAISGHSITSSASASTLVRPVIISPSTFCCRLICCLWNLGAADEARVRNNLAGANETGP